MIITNTPSNILYTPIAFLVFNRPEQTLRVFEEIRKAKPKTLLLVADGPRSMKSGEHEQCQAVRKIVNSVDWPCTVERNFSEENLGCKKRVSTGLDWVFSKVEKAIILEDDCLPDASFFPFCEQLLERYRNDKRVMQICGSNFLNGWRRTGESYYYSLFGPIWGWASWRRAWQFYDVDMKLWPEIKQNGVLGDFCLNQEEMQFRYDTYEMLYNGEIDTWDYQWGFAKMINSGYSITPNVNLISNIGFGADATHTSSSSDNPFANMKSQSIDLPLTHPKYMIRDTISDTRYLREFALKGIMSKNNSKLSIVRRFLDKVKNGN